MTAPATPQVSIVVPTSGRHLLQYTLKSLREQRDGNGDLYDPSILEILVVGDTHNDSFKGRLVRSRYYASVYGAKYLEHDGGTHCYGHPQRNYGQSVASAPWIAYIQDDDIWTVRALQFILQSINNNEHRGPRLFKTQTWQAGLVWRTQELFEGNIDANCIVTPNLPKRLAQWGMRYCGDFDFIRDTCALWLNKIVWEADIISIGRPAGREVN